MISIDVNSLNDREQVADAIAKLTIVLTALDAAAERRAKVRELAERDDIAEWARKIWAENTRGVGLTGWPTKNNFWGRKWLGPEGIWPPSRIVYRNSFGEAFTKPDPEIVTRFADLTGEDLDEMNAGPAEWPKPAPFMDPQEAIQDDGIVCLIDGEKRKFLSRYVRQVHGLEWREYLRRFDLPDDYPRTSKDVIEQRSKAATERGFGKHDRAPEIEEQVQVTVPVRRTFGRRSVPQQVSVKVDIGGSVNTTAERRKERRLGGLL